MQDGGGQDYQFTEYSLDYDAYNRNTSVCSAGCVQQNHYDAEGLRNAVTENGSTTNFVYRNGMLSSELDADRNPVRGYVYGNVYISQNNGSSFSYYLNDEQGSIRYLTGSDGSTRNHYRYSAFGESITAEETVPNRLKYNAQMADGLTGLYYLRARYYNASLGRFTQEDVIYNDGLNLYAYCNSNPVMYSDPSGFAKETCKSKVGGECGSESGSKTDVTTGLGYDAGDTPVRIDGDWTENDMKQALLGHPPRGLGSPDIHHGGQMPGGALHEVLPGQHRNNPALHPNTYNQGVTPEMRMEDRQLHWWYRAREQGADELLPDWIYD